MASSSDAKGFKQDLVVSIRYRNDLPPPPMPPKLLDIDTGGLAQYLTTSYASALAKREDPNVEVDAEGGMSLDMIGVPGYFLGDESAIMAPEVQPVLDPADHALMLTADQLRSQGAHNNVSFLRKTQYMTSQNAKTNDQVTRLNTQLRPTRENKNAQATLAREDKENIKRHIQKGFDIAYPESVPYNPPEARGQPSTQMERDAWRNPVHPDNPRLKPVSYFPILPDLDAVTALGGNWHRVKFDKPPLPPYRGRRDERIDSALLMASENPEQMPAWQAKKDAYDQNPTAYEDPGPEPYMWSLHLPKQQEAANKIKKVLNDADPDKDNSALLEGLLEESADGSMRIPFERSRIYPTAVQEGTDSRRFMALSLYNSETAPSKSRLRKQGNAAYYYPILERVRLKVDRGKLGKASQMESLEDMATNVPDQLMVLPREASAQEMLGRMQFRGEYDRAFASEFDELQREAQAEEEANKADDIIQEQGTLHEGAQDITMQEIQDAPEAEIKLNGFSHKDRDDDRNTPASDAEHDADAMDDD